MEMLGLEETLDRMAKANGVRWYGHVIQWRTQRGDLRGRTPPF